MCGLVGIASNREIKWSLYEALHVVQHRGQDAAGIATSEGYQARCKKNVGLARDVFDDASMLDLRGNVGIAHVRYPTAGSHSNPLLAQPFYVNYPYGIFLAHNGNLVNSDELKQPLLKDRRCHINTDSDSEVILNVFAQALQRAQSTATGDGQHVDAIFDAVREVHRQCRGAYATIALLCGHGLLAFRDPYGIRPLIFGKQEREGCVRYMFSSESAALDMLGFDVQRDVAPGEAIYIECDSLHVHKRQCVDDFQLTPCIFEHVYLARPDSVMDGILLHQARINQGEFLAKQILRHKSKQDIDVVVPVPDTGRTAAQMISQILGVDLREGFIKNRYVGRTFIMSDASTRRDHVRRKLNPIKPEFEGKNVLLVDDSIVRGTTSRQLIEMARQSGARKVYLVSAAPPVRYPNYYGIDIPDVSELIANGRDTDQVREAIGADWLLYQELEDLKRASQQLNPDIRDFECSVFDGKYIVKAHDEDPDAQYSQTSGAVTGTAKATRLPRRGRRSSNMRKAGDARG